MAGIGGDGIGDDAEDPVVHEVDVLLSRQLAEQLYLFQYPVRPAQMTYDDVPHLGARIKPGQQKVELELSINTSSPNYAQSKGEQIAINVDGAIPGDKSVFTSDKMDKQILSSIPVGISTSRFVAGCYHDGELHLTPMKGIVQLRPSFGYLDKVDNRQSSQIADTGESSQDEEDVKPVQVRFARRETEEAKNRRMASYDYISKKREEEHWVKVRYNPLTDSFADVERQMLVARQVGEASPFQMPASEYLQRLIPQMTEEESKKPAMPTNVLSMADLKNMTLSDQIKALLTNAKVIRFTQLMTLLPKGTDTMSALRALQQVALLVQGSWVVKSEVLYPKDTMSSQTGVPAETLCRGRDYVMWRFTQNRYVVRKDISTVVKLPAEDVKDILEQMAKLRINKGWEFLLDFDSEFVNRYPEVMQRQQMLWDAKFQQLATNLKLSKADLERKAKSAENMCASPEKPKRRRTVSRSRTKSGGDRSFSDLSDSDMDQPRDRIRRPSGSARSRRNSGIKQEIPMDLGMTSTSLASGEHLPNHVVNGPGTASCLNGTAGDKTTPVVSSELKQELVAFVIEKMSTRHVLSLSDLRRLFTLKLAECPSGHILSSGVSDRMLEQTVLEVGGIALPHHSEPIFALGKKNDNLNIVRTIMLDMLKEAACFRFSVLKKNVDEKTDYPVSEAEVRNVVKDYCVSKAAKWYLKGTVNSDS